MRWLELLFVIALFLYSFVIWSHRIKQKLRPWMIWVFGLGLASDVAGTVLLCAMTAQGWVFTLHTVAGLISLLVMALHFFWALLAITVGRKFEAHFNRFSLYAWFLWLIAFFSGIPLG